MTIWINMFAQVISGVYIYILVYIYIFRLSSVYWASLPIQKTRTHTMVDMNDHDYKCRNNGCIGCQENTFSQPTESGPWHCASQNGYLKGSMVTYFFTHHLAVAPGIMPLVVYSPPPPHSQYGGTSFLHMPSLRTSSDCFLSGGADDENAMLCQKHINRASSLSIQSGWAIKTPHQESQMIKS